MWPFSSSNETDTCDGECNWQDASKEAAYPNRIGFEDGRPFINKVIVQKKTCADCDATISLGTIEEKVFLEIDEVEGYGPE